MLPTFSIRTKLTMILLLGIAVLTLYSTIERFQAYQTKLAEQKQNLTQRLNTAFQADLNEQLQTYSLALETLLDNQLITSLFEDRQRTQLQTYLKSYYQRLHYQYGVAQFQFHLEPATSFLRLHKVSKFGDDLSEFRHTVSQANRSQQPVRGLEVGRGDLGSRVVYPVFANKKHIGSVELGGSALHLVDNLKQVFGIEYAVGIKQAVFTQARRFEAQDSDIIIGDTVFYSFSNVLARDLLTRYHPQQDKYLLHKRLYATHQIPLTDFSGRNIGYVLAISDLQALKEQNFSYLINSLWVNFLVALVIFVVLSFFLSHSIMRPLASAMHLAEEISKGHLNVRVVVKNRDEIGKLVSLIQNTLLQQIKSIIEESGTVLGHLARGDFHARIEGDFTGDFATIKQATNATAKDLQAIISETNRALELLASGDARAVKISGKFAGDFGQIKTALHTTAEKLAHAMQENERQNWLKSGQNQLGEHTSGEKSLLQLTEDIINFLAPYLDAQVGAIYLWQAQENNQHSKLKMVASHAYTWRESAVYEFAVGEGIIGQAALERKTFSVNNPPADYLCIRSGLGETHAKAILVAPFLYENEVKGVIELASLNHFTPLQLEFLNQVLSLIAIAINTAESRTRMQVLLEQTRIQAETLKTQQEELSHSNEELQSQTEELQAQQEELRQTNEELEERTLELEKQRRSIEKQNKALELAKMDLQNKAEELARASKYKSEFLANMSHELRTPLNSLLILSQLLMNNKEQNLNQEQIEYAQTIHNAGAELLELINDILDLSKVEAGHLEINKETVELHNFLDGLRQKFAPVARNKGLEFHIQHSDNVPSVIYTDAQRLRQIITNLLSNALKFTEKGQVSIDIARPPSHLQLRDLDLAHCIAFHVTDTGIGIAADKQQVIFEAFQQADGTTSRRFGGTGLGLSISRELTHLLGGEIQLSSTPNEGSCFSIYLPEEMPESNHLADTSAAMPSTQIKETLATPNIESASPVVQTNKSIINQQATSTAEELENLPSDDRNRLKPDDKCLLIIDDDEKFSKILQNLAREQGFQSIVAHSGADGLALAQAYVPNAILLDIGLPQMDGWTVMEKLKDEVSTRHIPVHFISGADASQDARQMGAIGYSLKPVSMTELSETLENIECFLNKSKHQLLLVSDQKQHQNNIQTLFTGAHIQIIIVDIYEQAEQQLNQGEIDCLVLDIGMSDNTGLGWLEHQCKQIDFIPVPIIVYVDRVLTEAEENRLYACKKHMVLKEVHSLERLLDEVTFFLHQVESNLTEEQQKILRKVHDKTAILQDKKVLLVDDDMRNVFALGSTLEKKGMEIIVAHDGIEALQLLEEHNDIALVLMDIMMPNMDGYETMRKIRHSPTMRKLPIIALTAKAMKGDKTKCIDAGANDYLAKPVDPERLVSLLRVWLYQ